MDVQASPITRAVLDHLPVLEFLRANGAAPAADIAQATSRVPSNVRRDLPKLVEGGLLTRTPAGGDEGAVDAYALDAAAILALEAMDRARNPALGEAAAPTGVHAEFAPNPDQPRKKFDQQKLEELADTVEEHGVIEPIVVLPPREDGLKLIHAGERRWRAAGIVNARHDDPNRVRIPYVIRAVPSQDEALEAKVVALVENGQRENLTTYEEAVALRGLIPSKYPSARQAAKPLGFDEKTVQDRLKALATLQGEDLERWKADEITWREVRNIFRPPAPNADADPAQMDIEDVTGGGLSAQQVPASLLSDKAAAEALDGPLIPALQLVLVEIAQRVVTDFHPDHAVAPALIQGWEPPTQLKQLLSRRLADWGRYDDQAFVRLMPAGAAYLHNTGLDPNVNPNAWPAALEAARVSPARITELGASGAPHTDWLAAGFTYRPADGQPTEPEGLLLIELAYKMSQPTLTVMADDGTGPWVRTDGYGYMNREVGWLVKAGRMEDTCKNVAGRYSSLVRLTDHGWAWVREHYAEGEEITQGDLVEEAQSRLGHTKRAEFYGRKWPYAFRYLVGQGDENDLGSAYGAPPRETPATNSLAEIASAKVGADMTGKARLAVVEVAHKISCDDIMAAIGGFPATRVSSYWLDTNVEKLRSLGLIKFFNAGGEDGWVVQAGDNMVAWLVGQGLSAEDGLVLDRHLEAARNSFGQAGWPGPGYVTPWLNVDEADASGEAILAAEAADREIDAVGDPSEVNEGLDEEALDTLVADLRAALYVTQSHTEDRWHHAEVSMADLASKAVWAVRNGEILDALIALMGMLAREGEDDANEALRAYSQAKTVVEEELYYDLGNTASEAVPLLKVMAQAQRGFRILPLDADDTEKTATALEKVVTALGFKA